MQILVVRLFVIVLLATVVGNGNALAFYVEGLMSGMSSTTVEKILQKHGFETTEVRADGSIVARNSQEDGRVVIAFFCDDRLVQVQNDFGAEFSNFVNLVEKTRKELGAHASARVIPAASGPEAAGNAVIFSWLDEATTVEVVYAERETSPQVSLVHRVKSSCR